MRTDEVDAALAAAENALREGRSLGGTGFWTAVNATRQDLALAERFGDRIAAIDRAAFERGVKVRVPLAVGVVVLLFGTAVGIAAVIAALRAADVPAVEYLSRGGIDLYGVPGFVPVAFLVGFGAILVSTHTLAHWLVGESFGIRFTHLFLPRGKPPGVKIDYASYLRAPPRARAVMHASGAVVSKLVPFTLLRASLQLYYGWPWLTWLMLAIGVFIITTDVVYSTKSSDWKKASREWRAAKRVSPR